MALQSHKSQVLPLKNRVIPVDKDTAFLAHYDINTSDVLKGVVPITDVSTLRADGLYGKAVAIEDATTNLADLTGIGVYAYATKDGEFAVDNPDNVYPVYSYTVNSLSGAARGRKTLPAVQGTTYSLSIIMKKTGSGSFTISPAKPSPESSNSITVSTLYSNTVDLGGGWYRLTATYTITANTVAECIFCFGISGGAIGDQFWAYNLQWEQKNYSTSYVNGSRSAGLIEYPISILNQNEGTLSFWAKLPYSLPFTSSAYEQLYMTTSTGYAGTNSLNFQAFNSNYNTRIIGCHWAGTDASSNHVPLDTTQVTNYNNGDWNMFTITWKNPNGYKVYVNGKLAGSAAVGKTLKPFDSNKLTIKGMLLDELRIDKTERTVDEILAWYYSNSPFWPKGIYTVGY